MDKIKVGINGFGTIGKRVADAIDAQDDMVVVGVTKTGPSFGCKSGYKEGLPFVLYIRRPGKNKQFFK